MCTQRASKGGIATPSEVKGAGGGREPLAVLTPTDPLGMVEELGMKDLVKSGRW